MRFITFTIFLILISIPVFSAAQVDFDSLLNKSKTIGLSNVERAVELATDARDIAIQNGNKVNHTEANRQLIYLYLRVGSFDKTREVLADSEILYREMGDQKGMASVFASYGDIALYEGRNFESSSFFHQALEIATDLNLGKEIISYKRRIANLLTQSNDFETSVRILKEAYQEAVKLNERTAQADILNGIGGNYHDMGKMDSSIIIDRIAVALMDSINDAEGKAMVLTNLAYSQLEYGLIEEARDTLELSRSILDTVDSPSILANYEMLIAYYHFLKGDYDKAQELCYISLNRMKEFNYKLEEIWIEELLYKILKKKGDYKTALSYLEGVIELKDTLVYQEKNKQALELFSKYQAAEKDTKLALQEVKIQNSLNQRNIAYAGGFGLLAFGGFLFYRNRKNQKLSSSKIENLEKQQKLMALDYMVQGQEEERKRIAQDLHDGLGGLLSSAQLQIQSVQNEINKLGEMNLLNQAESMINNACTEVRRISHDMMPSALMDLGLIDALEDLIQKTKAEHMIQISLKDNTGDLELSDIQKVQLYRIYQELLNNTVKHAEATAINIEFNLNDNQILASYSDNGKGFNVDEAHLKDGIGLKNIESRIKYLNGTVQLESERGGGTKYMIRMPE